MVMRHLRSYIKASPTERQNPEMEKRCIKVLGNVPKLVLIALPLEIIMIAYTTYINTLVSTDLVSTLMIGIFYNIAVYNLVYMLALIVVGQYNQYFHYQPDLKKQSNNRTPFYRQFDVHSVHFSGYSIYFSIYSRYRYTPGFDSHGHVSLAVDYSNPHPAHLFYRPADQKNFTNYTTN